MSRLAFMMFLSLVWVWTGCNKVSSRKDLDEIRGKEKIADQNREAYSKGKEKLDLEFLADLGDSYMEFAEKYPEAPQTPDYLFRAGELYSNELKDLPNALAAFEKNYKGYPQHETAANALFFTGYLYHNNLNDLIRAEEAYKQFLAKYPSHNMAPHAEFELQSLGMSPDRVFEKIINQSQRNLPDSVP